MPIRRVPTNKGLTELKLTNWILAGSIAIAIISVLFGLTENRKLRFDNGQLRSQLVRLAGSCDGPRVGDIVPDIEVEGSAGKRLSIRYDNTSKYLFFFLSFKCGECIKELPQWSTIAKTAKSNRFIVLGLATDNEDSPHALQDPGFDILRLRDSAVLRAYRVSVTPTIMLVSETGRIEWVNSSALSEKSRNELLTVVAGKSVIEQERSD